MSSLGNFLET